TQLFVSPQSHDRFLGLLREKGRAENFECRAQTGDGREIWLRMHARIARQAEDDFVIEGFTTDITAQRKLEEQFRQAQKMESVGRLAGGVAHDYNNMLSVILGYTELALDRVSPADPLHADLQEVYKAATRSTEVTRQLLAFARKQAIAPRILDLNETVAGMLKMLRRLIGEDIDLAWRPGEGLCPVRMDPSQIDQILVNLCVNARDAIAGVGRITIETGRTAIDQAYCDDHEGFTPGDFVVLAVSDDGCGMSREARERLFEPFFTTKEVGKGTGLGLATVYGIVKQNRGCVNVYSEPGKGTIFRIYLPCHGETVAVSDQLSPAPLSGGQGETILVVEDETAILTMSTTMLQRLGYAVLPAGSIDEAIRLAREHEGKIHLLITDVIMPDMNGRDLADRLHDLYPDMKILFMSGYTANVIAHHGVLDADVCFIQKPFSIKELAAKVREALARP
ncbi:MAG: ATP-binding protein, partial [Thermodesulfobacteriota bacterium]